VIQKHASGRTRDSFGCWGIGPNDEKTGQRQNVEWQSKQGRQEVINSGFSIWLSSIEAPGGFGRGGSTETAVPQRQEKSCPVEGITCSNSLTTGWSAVCRNLATKKGGSKTQKGEKERDHDPPKETTKSSRSLQEPNKKRIDQNGCN